jgi:dephospho-CoA kinase
VEKEFPGTKKKDGSIDRDLLGGIVFNDPQKLHKLEKIVHPLIKKAELDFLQEARRANVRAVVLEIPLLFETGADARCNITLCVAAPPAEQKARVLARPNMNEDKFLAVLERQMPNAEKCNLADYVVPTGVSLAETEDYLRSLFEKLGLMKKEP